MVIGKFGIWCAAVFAAVSAAALPPAFSVGREGRLRIGDELPAASGVGSCGRIPESFAGTF